jgi:CDP-6-deoxy-D-xylo-4-hexulose-3-dehydrase
MTTIEGGMICTNDRKIYETTKILRSHGMARECKNKNYENKIIKRYKNLSPQFIFLHPTLNFRNNEIGACIGINQLKKLNSNNQKRSINFNYFLKNLDEKKYWKNYNTIGSSNYAFPIILRTFNLKKRDHFEFILKKKGIEFRRGNAGGGNQLRQPYLKEYTKNIRLEKFPNVEKVHFFGYYIGNYPNLSKVKINLIVNILNKINI